MSQHDMDLANQAGAAFRADANLALVALVGNNSGATAPATTFAYMWWPDTTTGLLKIRNAANSAWITVGTLASLGDAIYTTAGDIVQATAAAVRARLAIGTAGQFPAVNAGATALAYQSMATQADQETSTSILAPVTPGRQQYHPSAAKAWIKCDIAGTINASYNVTSITDTGAGDVLVTWATDFTSGNYCANASFESSVALAIRISSTTLSGGSIQIQTYTVDTPALTDPVTYCVAAFGDQ